MYPFLNCSTTHRYDFVKEINVESERKEWEIKVRIISLWKLDSFVKYRHQKPSIEIVVMDEQVVFVIFQYYRMHMIRSSGDN